MNKLENLQPTVINFLKRSFLKGHLSHAYLFYGNKGCKKLDTAFYFAKMLYCLAEDYPCEECNNCKRINSLTHPNVFLVNPETQVIKKEQVIDILKESNKTSVEEGPKIFIINQVDKLNAQSAKSLLKFIEEPHEGIYVILITEKLSSVLPTIRSRTQLIHFPELNKEAIKESLTIKGYDKVYIDILTEYTNDETQIEKIINDNDLIRVVDFVPNLFNVKVERKESMIIYFNDYYELISNNKEKEDLFLSVLSLYLLDFLKILSSEDNIIFSVERKRIEELSRFIDKEPLMSLIYETLDMKQKIRYNVNEKLMFDSLLIKIQSLFIK